MPLLLRVPICIIAATISLGGSASETSPPPADAFARLRSLAGEWEADLPGYGKVASTIRVVSNGTAVEETIGTPDDNEISIYTRDGDRILLTHFCALTPGGHVVRLAAQPLPGRPERLEFAFVGASNLGRIDDPHMRGVVSTFSDANHFSESWTKVESGKDTVFELRFVRR